MQIIEIKAKDFFELLKIKDTSMWEIFSQMIDGKEKKLVFLDQDNTVLFGYQLPTNTEQLEKDREIFAKEYAEKISKLN